MSAKEFSRWLRDRRDPERAVGQARFFQVSPGGYAEHDQFLGIPVPEVRRGVRQFRGLVPREALSLVGSPWHEERLAGLLCWVDSFQRAGSEAARQEIASLYLEHRTQVNNWDLVDSSAHLILGPWWEAHPSPTHFWELTRSPEIWDRRIAVLSTFHGIRHGRPDACLEVCEALMGDSHDLIHKATGWMLREAGKRDPEILRAFLVHHAGSMPRTMLRYAIEKFDPSERKTWMDAKKQG
jgi:DNA alkylation repair enzyme